MPLLNDTMGGLNICIKLGTDEQYCVTKGKIRLPCLRLCCKQILTPQMLSLRKSWNESLTVKERRFCVGNLSHELHTGRVTIYLFNELRDFIFVYIPDREYNLN